MLCNPESPVAHDVLLVVEASSDAGSMAVFRGDVVLAHVAIAMGRGRDDLLTPSLAPLMAQTGLSIRDLDGVVCGEGPGSFTSLRIAAAFCKGLAFGLDVPLFAVPSLALVSSQADQPLATGAYCVFTDALRDECYAQRIDVTSDNRINVSSEVVRVHTRDLPEFADGRELVHADAKTSTHARASMLSWFDAWRAAGPVSLDAWEPAYGRLAEAQVKWEAAHGRALGQALSATAVVLRSALPDDVYAMAHIEAAAFSDPWPASGFRELLAAPAARVTVAERAGTVIGYTVMMVAADEGELANIAVRDAERGQGLGRRLLDAALVAATQNGVRSVFLEVRESNSAARGLYTSVGFTEIGRRARYYDKPTEDALIMHWVAPLTAAK